MNYRGKCSLCRLKVTEIDGIEYVKPGRTPHRHKLPRDVHPDASEKLFHLTPLTVVNSVGIAA